MSEEPDDIQIVDFSSTAKAKKKGKKKVSKKSKTGNSLLVINSDSRGCRGRRG